MEKIIDENYYDFIVDNTLLTPGNTDYVTFLNTRHSILHVSSENTNMCDLGRHPYHRFPTLYTLNSQLSLGSSDIPRIQQNPALALYGLGIIVAVVDTGIDYQHPAFRHKDGTSRIHSIWDQSIQGNNPPEGFNLGTEYSNESINLALKTQDPLSLVPSVDTDGHGTAIASIIAGSSNSDNGFSGVVPQADLVIVKLKDAKKNIKKIFCVSPDSVCFQQTDIILGLRYIFETAAKLNRPLVVCLAFGSSLVGHESFGATSSYIYLMSQRSHVAFSISAGNEGNNQRHFFGNVPSAPLNKEFELKVSSQDSSFCFQVWPDIQARLSIQITSPSGERTPAIYPTLKNCDNYNFIFGNEKTWINNILIEEENGVQLILVRFNDATEGIWRIRIENINQVPFSFNCWLPSGDLISNETYFIPSEPDTTITAPGNTGTALTVTAYDQFNNSTMSQSSRGYTRLGQIKPDIAAPGNQIPCAVPNGSYSTLTGTGAASAHAAGVIAMILEWAVVKGNFTSITGKDINSLLIRSAVGIPPMTYPNTKWGYGILNVNNLFELLTYI